MRFRRNLGHCNIVFMDVVWKSIPGWPGYEVGNDGAVRCWNPRNARALAPKEPRLIKPHAHPRTGYMVLTLCKQGVRTTRLVHQLVLEAFVGPRPEKAQARHFPDPTRSNNRLDNLSWCTAKENAADKHVHGSSLKGRKQRPEWIAARMAAMPPREEHVARMKARAARGELHYMRAAACLRRGEASPLAKLTESTVRRILDLRKTGHTSAQISEETGVKVCTVLNIMSGRGWKHIPRP